MGPPWSADAVIVIPGIMGSELVDDRGHVLWGLKPSVLFRQLCLGDIFERLRLAPGAPDDGVRPSRLLHVPAYMPMLEGAEPYTELVRSLQAASVQEHAVLAFPYDWRRSVAHNAQLLAPVARAHLERWRATYRGLPGLGSATPEPQLTLVCHSMGGLIGRYFAEVLDGASMVRQIITLGTPFGGSIKAVRLLARGNVLPFGLFADHVCAAARTFPGVYDLLPRYPCLIGVLASEPATIFQAVDAEGVGGDLALAQAAEADSTTLRQAVANAGTSSCLLRPVIGVAQPTLASLRIVAGEAIFSEMLAGTQPAGDSTVPRNAAWPAGTAPTYLPQKHGQLASTKEATTHVVSILTEQAIGPFQGEGLGLRLPDAALAGVPFEVGITAEAGGRVTVRLLDADTRRQLDRKSTVPRAGGLSTQFTVRDAGLYRISASGGAFSPVEDLLVVLP